MVLVNNDDAGLPSAIHIVIVAYGKTYCELLAEITLANLAALVREIEPDLRHRSVVRILTRAEDAPTIEASAALPVLRESLRVEISDALEMSGFEQHGDYGPMVLTQRKAVLDAAQVNAALFFVGPDQIYSRGAFAHFVDVLRQGYRVIIGPSPRVVREASRRALRRKIAESADGTFALTQTEQIDFFFCHLHPINDQFMLESPRGILWKACLYHRPRPDEFFFRFIQGPTLVAWPRGPLSGFDGFVDHRLILGCCRSWREAYVISNARDCLALDLTADDRVDIQALADLPRPDLLTELFDHRAINEMQLLYALRTCRIYRGDPGSATLSRQEQAFARGIDPLILAAVAERKLARRLGRGVAWIFRVFCRLNANTLCLLLGGVAARVARPFKEPFPLPESQ